MFNILELYISMLAKMEKRNKMIDLHNSYLSCAKLDRMDISTQV